MVVVRVELVVVVVVMIMMMMMMIIVITIIKIIMVKMMMLVLEMGIAINGVNTERENMRIKISPAILSPCGIVRENTLSFVANRYDIH